MNLLLDVNISAGFTYPRKYIISRNKYTTFIECSWQSAVAFLMYDYNYIPKVEFVEVQCRDYLILISGIFVLLYGDNRKFVIRNNNNGWSVYNDRQRRWSDTKYCPLYKIVTECIESQIINYYYSESWHYARLRNVYLNTNTFIFYYKGIEYNLQLYKLPNVSKLLENNLLNSDKQYLNTRCRHFTVM